jgi:hypothetical protein
MVRQYRLVTSARALVGSLMSDPTWRRMVLAPRATVAPADLAMPSSNVAGSMSTASTPCHEGDLGGQPHDT